MFRRWLETLGRKTVLAVEQLGEVSSLFGETVYLSFRPAILIGRRRRNILEQMVNVGVLSLPVVVATGIFTGMALAVQSYYALHRFTLESGIGALLGLSIARELGPVLTGLMLAGRVGASVAAELGTMKVTEQIDALQTMGTNPVSYLVVPRFLACLFLLPVLTIFTDFIAMVGGYLISVQMLGINSAFYLSFAVEKVAPHDITSGLVKALFFGMIIATISCHRGLKATGGAEGVGRVTTAAVVSSCILILISDFFLSVFFEIIHF